MLDPAINISWIWHLACREHQNLHEHRKHTQRPLDERVVPHFLGQSEFQRK
jgi:hypothetical protein